MLRRLLVLLVIGGVMLAPFSHAADDFRKNNPDVMKYEFARSYITALGYMKEIHDRWVKSVARKFPDKQKNKMILATINDLSLDSTDLFIIKHYLLKYLISPNMLIRKVADMVVVATSEEIVINHEEKTLWQKWYDLTLAGQASRSKEKDFVREQYSLELQRKEADKEIIKATIMMTKVLKSEENRNSKGHLLAITAQQRQKLLDKLDSYGSDTLDWGLQTGQSTLDGSIAVIREILEDSIWISLDEK